MPPITPVQPPVTTTNAVATPPPLLPVLSENLLSAPQKDSWGATLGSIIILLVLIVGALYFWGAKLAEQDEEEVLVPKIDTAINFTDVAEVENPTTTEGFEMTP